jgi:hypothetical protein
MFPSEATAAISQPWAPALLNGVPTVHDEPPTAGTCGVAYVCGSGCVPTTCAAHR